jgi:hypothetical protein
MTMTMPMPLTPTLPISAELLLSRGRFRYPELDVDVVAQLAEEAAAAANERDFPDQRRRAVAGHVQLAQLASAHLAQVDQRILLTAALRLEAIVPADHALAEHLHASLDEETLLAAALRRSRRVPFRVAARALNLATDELRDLERTGMEKAAQLTLGFHESMLCEPAALSQADKPALRTLAVQQHLEVCGRCNSEFWERAAHVLAHAGAMLVPLPALALDPRHSTHRALGGVRMPWFTRRPRPLSSG